MEISNNKLNTGIIVVPDSVLKGVKPKYNYFTGIYKEKNAIKNMRLMTFLKSKFLYWKRWILI